MIEAAGLTKRYGAKTAVYNLSFQVRPGAVTGFLGPNGSGKSTTMRMILGLDAPSEGRATIGGLPYRELPNAPRRVGALLDAKAVHGGRSARQHLLCVAQLSGIPARRVDEVLGVVGLPLIIAIFMQAPGLYRVQEKLVEYSTPVGLAALYRVRMAGDYDDRINGLPQLATLAVVTALALAGAYAVLAKRDV